MSILYVFFFFKQKTAYEMRISDWSSDVCSSDLDVLVECAQLAVQGVHEITLLGQNVNAYRGAMGGTHELCDLALLIAYLAQIPGIERFRYTTSHPAELSDALIDAYAEQPKLDPKSVV